MGNVNEYLYRVAARQASEGAAAKYLHTEIPGFNGLIQSNISPTYNASTGVGTPVVKELVGAGTAASAGTRRQRPILDPRQVSEGQGRGLLAFFHAPWPAHDRRLLTKGLRGIY